MDGRGSRWRAVLIALASVCWAGCQSYEEGIQVMCESATVVDTDGLDPPARAAAAAEWISEHLENPDARVFFRALAPLPPERKAAAVRRAAAEAGLAECAIADIWDTPWGMRVAGG